MASESVSNSNTKVLPVTHCYIGRHKICGCLVAVVVDDPKYVKDTAKSVADFIKSGYAVERISLEGYHSLGKYGHHCEASNDPRDHPQGGGIMRLLTKQQRMKCAATPKSERCGDIPNETSRKMNLSCQLPRNHRGFHLAHQGSNDLTVEAKWPQSGKRGES